MGVAKNWTNNQIEPLSSDPLSRLDCICNVVQQYGAALIQQYGADFCEIDFQAADVIANHRHAAKKEYK